MKRKEKFSNESPDRLNVIVEGSKIIGDVITESSLRIDGEVQGNISSAAKVVIGKTGLLTGNLNAGEADIEGSIFGTLNIEGLLSLRANANINGDITTSAIEIEEGAKFSGTCKMSNMVETKAPELKPQDDLVY